MHPKYFGYTFFIPITILLRSNHILLCFRFCIGLMVNNSGSSTIYAFSNFDFMKKKLILTLFSATFLLVWGLGFLNSSANKTTAILAFAFTIVTPYFFQKEYPLKIQDKFIILFFPSLYLAAFTFLHGKIAFSYFINPLFISLIVLILVLNNLKDLSIFRNSFIVAFIALFYVFTLFPDWQKSRIIRETTNFDDHPSETTKPKSTINESINLFDYSFITPNLDTSIISTNKDFILIETWNETCLPCIKAFKEMPPFYKSQKEKLAVYYLYEHRKESVRRKFDKIFKYKKIKDKSKILIDIDQKLYLESKMNGYPYFLIFDKSGKLVFSQKGYSSDYRKDFERKILDIIKK